MATDTGDPNKIEIEIALRDSFSAAFQAMAREMGNANRKAQESSRGGGGFAELERTIGGISKSLLGPLGIAGGLYAAARSLDTFAVGQLQMKNFTRDTGFAKDEITQMRQQLGTLGVPLEQANKMIGSFAGKLEEASAIPWGTPMIQMLNDTNPALARQVQEYANSGEKMKALDAIYKTYINSNKAGQAAIQRATQMSRTEILAHGQDVSGLIKPWKELDKGADEYHRKMLDLDTSFQNIWRSVSQNAIKNINEMTGGFESMDKAAHSLAERINNEVNKTFKDVIKIVSDLKEVREKGVGSFLKKYIEEEVTIGGRKIGPNVLPSRPALGNIPGKQSSLEEGTTDFSARGRTGSKGEDLLDTEEDSNKLLRDMRDILDRMESGRPAPGGGPGGPGSGPGGLGTDPMGRLPGMRRRDDGGQASHDFPVDQSGKPIDSETVAGLQQLASRGDTVGMRAFMTSKGYRVDSAWCGDLAKALVQGSGYAPPKVGYPVASNWRQWGQHMDPADINTPGRPFGSMVLSKTNVPIGSTGGHVMTPVPGTYDPKTGTVEVIDTGGRRRRSVAGFEGRYAGDEAVSLAQERARGISGMPAGKAFENIPQSSTAAAGIGGAGAFSGYLANQRAAIFAKIDSDPRLRAEVAATLGHEGNTKEQARNTLESLVNRMAADGSTNVMKYLNSGFYGPRNRGEVGPPNAGLLKQFDWAAGQVRAGSNVIALRTDQGMLGVPGHRDEVFGPRAAKIQGEGYGDLSERHRRWSMVQESLRKKYDDAVADMPKPFEQFGGIGAPKGPTAFEQRFSAMDSNKLTDSLSKKTADTRGVSGTLSAEVDFKNTAFTKSSSEAPRFKPLRVTSAFSQNQRAGEGMLYPTDSAHTAWVP